MNRAPRSQDPLYAGAKQGQRGQYDTRNPTGGNASLPRTNGRAADTPENAQSRAAKFEDEKRRIVESVFSKKDDDGIQVESYITHVRVVEDAMYPISPPPPEADAGNKKNRVILVAVRRSGRVRVHKARENPNGSFSIGKTWNLDELGSIQSYTNLISRSNQEQMEKQWAGGSGFVVTLGKAYYWQAPTAKEKDFFIASLIKIYRKYTGGKLPELYGFSNEEVEALTGLPPTQPVSKEQNSISSATSTDVAEPPRLPTPSERRPQSPHFTRGPTADVNRDPLPRLGSQPGTDHQSPKDLPRSNPAPLEPFRSPARNRLSFGTGEPTPPAPLFAATQRSTSSPQSSQTSLAASERLNASFNGLPARPKPSFSESTQKPPSIQSTSSRPSTAVSEQKSFDQRSDRQHLSEEQSSERKRPPQTLMYSQAGSKSALASESESSFATPAASPGELSKEMPAIATTARNNALPSSKSTPQQDYTQSTEISDSSPIVSPAEPPSSTMSSNASPLSPESVSAREDFRPGLGPMIKKKSAKDIAGQFRKAAMAASAFQPRQGGGAARLKALKEREKASSEPDGITGVIPAPISRGQSSEKVAQSAETPLEPGIPEKQNTSGAAVLDPTTQTEQTMTDNTVNRFEAEQIVTPPGKSSTLPTSPMAAKSKPEKRESSPDRARSRSPQRRKRQRQQAEVAKYCSSLGIDARIFDGKGADFNDLLTEFGWQGRLTEERKIEEFETEIRREIGRAQATGWLGHVEQQEGKVQDLAKAFDKAIDECEELDGLFTLYSHELDTLAADIEYIEAQSQGLQVQTANQKLLQNELQTLLKTLAIPQTDLRGIKSGSLDTPGGVEKIEKSLALLYKALITIDPDIRQNKIRQAQGTGPERSGVGIYADTEIGQMRAVRERKDDYREETVTFVRRFNQHMTGLFKQIEQRAGEDSTRNTMASTRSFDARSPQNPRQELWTYNALMLFVREVNSYEWQTLIASYEMNIKRSFQDQFRDFSMSRKRAVHKPSGEELEALFTTQEKERVEEGLASTAARKLTVRRGKNPRTGNLKHGNSDKRDGKPDAWEVFDGVLQHQTKIIAEEQNFVVHFFHLNSQANVDFAEIVSARAPNERKLPNLHAKQSYDPDRTLAKIVQGVVESIYHFWASDLQNLLDWTLGVDQLQGVGILGALEQCLAAYEETNQEYITRTVRALHDRLVGLFHRFVDEQIKAIEETKVKIKKRKGIISFMRTFPVFSSMIEHMIPPEAQVHDALEVRFIVNESYQKILKAMWESLNFIAKDDPTGRSGVVHSTAPTSGDPEDKEALNYHILLIENMSHYAEEVDTHGNVVLEEWADKALKDMSTHMNQYIEAVIRRPLGKWLDFVESTEAMMRSDSVAIISNKPSHSRGAAKKVLAAYDAKEVRKGADTLKKRIEKHFGDGDDLSSTAKGLIIKICDDCSHRYASAWERMQTIIDQLYEGSLEIDWKREEVQALLRAR